MTANLNNPAFCSELLRLAAKSYFELSSQRLPFSLSFLILPFVLPGMIREKLPRTSRTTLHHWLNENEELKPRLVDHIQGFIPFTKEALMFGIAYNNLTISDLGEIETTITRLAPTSNDPEVASCFSKSILIGKLLAKAGNSFTIYSLLGIKP